MVADLDEKSEGIVRDNPAKLEDPYPGQGQGDEKRITWRSEAVYRFHTRRTWTARGSDEDETVVEDLRVMPIDQAHTEHESLIDAVASTAPGLERRGKATAAPLGCAAGRVLVSPVRLDGL